MNTQFGLDRRRRREKEGFIAGRQVRGSGELVVELRWRDNGVGARKRVIRPRVGVPRTRPALRLVQGQPCVWLIATSQGIRTDAMCRKEGRGGRRRGGVA